jgi:diadenosine tetraphosphate (Ap4A) HIT family hydrolase
MINNNGHDAGQVIFHTHFHLIPFYETKDHGSSLRE